MKSIIPITLLSGLVLLLPSLASANEFTVKNVKNPHFSESDFPFFVSEKYPESASRINIFLQYYYFDKTLQEEDFASKSSSPFRTTDSYRRVFSFYEPIVTEKKNYIEVTISGDACGAYCEWGENTFLFDKYSGRPITLVDLLSPEGTKSLEIRLRSDNLNRVKKYIINKPDDNSDEYIMGEYYLYNDCYQNRFRDNYDKIDEDTNFHLSDNLLTITFGRCSNHASRALDEIGKFENTLSYEELKPYLSNDGIQYLSNQTHSLSNIQTPYRVFRGKIADKYPITVVNIKHGGWSYWYDKYQTPIELHKVDCVDATAQCFKEGRYDNMMQKWVYTAEWKMNQYNDSILGSFIRISDGKRMSISIK